MKTKFSMKMAITWIACLGLLSPTAVFGQAPQSSNSVTVRDIALAKGNVLTGQVVDSQGNRLVNQPVTIQRDGTQALQLTTDAVGQFRATGLPGGVYTVSSAGNRGVYRMWSNQTAPPVAAKGLLMVGNDAVVRGQCFNGCGPTGGCDPCMAGQSYGTAGQGLLGLLANPWFVTAAVAAAVAIPLAIDDDDAS
ncbi:MAG: carboxypeptidase-like regulatory domain-containing protein [Planctomycetota bacterium]